MPLNANEIEGLDTFIETKVNDMASVDSVPDTLVKRTEGADIQGHRVKAEQYAVAGGNFAGNTLVPVEAETSNDPDDLLTKLNEVIAAINLGRTGS